jgi:tetratricopeptide (TPR) repeat protein
MHRIAGAEDEALYWSIRARQGMGVRSLVRAGEAEPDSIRICELLAESYRDMGRYAAAEEEYAAALRIDPNDFPALLGSAATYLQEYRLQPAWEAIERALAQQPVDPEANYVAGEILVDQHRFDDAEPYLKHALTAKAELVPRIHALLGRIYANQGKEQQAIEELKLYQKTGQPKQAEAAFTETRRLQTLR